MNSNQRLLNRAYVLSNLEQIIKESIYYRTHSEEFEKYNPIIVGNVRESQLKAKLI